MNTAYTCPMCGHKHREDRKTINRWMALALQSLEQAGPGIIHAASYLQQHCPDGARGHDYALLRHWGLLAPTTRPASAEKGQKGSRGLSGFYVVTPMGKLFAQGKANVHGTIVRPVGSARYSVDNMSPRVNINDALRTRLKANSDEQVIDGTGDC